MSTSGYYPYVNARSPGIPNYFLRWRQTGVGSYFDANTGIPFQEYNGMAAAAQNPFAPYGCWNTCPAPWPPAGWVPRESGPGEQPEFIPGTAYVPSVLRSSARSSNPAKPKTSCCLECHFSLEETELAPYLPRKVMARLKAEHRNLIRRGLPLDEVHAHAEREMVWFRQAGVPQWLLNKLETDHDAAGDGDLVAAGKRQAPCTEPDACTACKVATPQTNPSQDVQRFTRQKRKALDAARRRARRNINTPLSY